MWLFTSSSYVSAVKHRSKEHTLHVRARYAGDIEEIFPNAEVKMTPNADYAFRADVSKIDFVDFLITYTQDLEYTNFKDSVSHQHPFRYSAYMDVWSTTRDYQQVF
jgi:hypothetical protein